MFEPGRIFVNTSVRVDVTFLDSAGAAVDPTTVTFKTCSPNGQKASYVYDTDAEVGRSGVGTYYADIVPDKAGRWYIRWETTGTGTTVAIEDNFLVKHSPFFDSSETAYMIP